MDCHIHLRHVLFAGLLSFSSMGVGQVFLCDSESRKAGPGPSFSTDVSGYDVGTDGYDEASVSLLSSAGYRTNKDTLKRKALREKKKESPVWKENQDHEYDQHLKEDSEDKKADYSLSIIPKADQRFLLEQTLKLKEGELGQYLERNAAYLDKSTCDIGLVGAYVSAEQSLLGRTSDREGFVRSYLGDREKFKGEKADLLGLVGDYISKAKAVLKNCYTPAEKSQFVKDHRLLERIGTITNGDAVCTAFGFGGERYLLTARHCFTDDNSLPRVDRGQVFFSPAGSTERYQVCSVMGADALEQDQISKLKRDQVVVSIAALKQSFSKASLFNASQLVSVAKGGKNARPTRLAQVSYFPLASVISPEEFSSGFVANESCVPIKATANCFSHICNSVKGASGSPIFSADSPRLELVGTHIGRSSGDVDTCTNVGSSVNAAAYPQKELERIIKAMK